MSLVLFYVAFAARRRQRATSRACVNAFPASRKERQAVLLRFAGWRRFQAKEKDALAALLKKTKAGCREVREHRLGLRMSEGEMRNCP